MPQKSLQPIPRIRIGIDIRHATPQTRLQLGGMPLEQVHNRRPRDAGKHGPGVVADGGAGAGVGDGRQALAGLHGQAGQRQHHARKHVDDDLLVDARDLARAPRALPEDDVAAQQAGEEAVVRT